MTLLILKWLAVLPVLMLLNRIRGGGMSSLTDRLPGRALYYVGAMIGALTAAVLDPVLGALVALGFPLWGAAGWGLWFDLHRHDSQQTNDPRRNDLFVRLVDTVSCGSDHVALFLRLSLFLLPLLVAWCAVTGTPYTLLVTAAAFGLLGVGAYELRWRTTFGNTLSEMLVGALWWLLILTMALAAPARG
jgi:hypothetical protein